MVAMEILLVLVEAALVAIINAMVVMLVVMVVAIVAAKVTHPVAAHQVSVFVISAKHLVIINAIVVIVVIAQLAIVVINVQIAKLVIHNVIQIISDYFYALLYYFLQLILTPINYLLIVWVTLWITSLTTSAFIATCARITIYTAYTNITACTF